MWLGPGSDGKEARGCSKRTHGLCQKGQQYICVHAYTHRAQSPISGGMPLPPAPGLSEQKNCDGVLREHTDCARKDSNQCIRNIPLDACEDLRVNSLGKRGEHLPRQSEKDFIPHCTLNIKRCTNNDVDDDNSEYRSQVRSVITWRRIQAVNDHKLEDGRRVLDANTKHNTKHPLPERTKGSNKRSTNKYKPPKRKPELSLGTTIGNPHTHDKSDVKSNIGHLKDVLEYLLSHCVALSPPSIMASCGTSAHTSNAILVPRDFALARAADFIISGSVILLNSSQRECVVSAISRKQVRNLFGGGGALALDEQPSTVGRAAAMM